MCQLQVSPQTAVSARATALAMMSAPFTEIVDPPLAGKFVPQLSSRNRKRPTTDSDEPRRTDK